MIAVGRRWEANRAPKGAYSEAQEWLRYVKAGQQISSLTDNVIEVSYETLMSDGAATLLRVFESVGLESNEVDCEDYLRLCSFESQGELTKHPQMASIEAEK